MGVLPLQLIDGQSWQSLGLSGEETIDIPDLDNDLKPGQTVLVTATSSDGSKKDWITIARIDTPVERDYYRHGGILPMMLRRLLTTLP